MRSRRIAFVLLLPAVLLVAGVLSLTMPFSLTNVAETTPDHPDAMLRTRHYPAPPGGGGVGSVAAVVNALIPTLTTYGRHWRLVAPATLRTGAHAMPDDANTRTVVAEVPVLFFTDDLRVDLKRGVHDGEVLVDVRSASRVGKSDLGENRRHILQLLRALDTQLAP